MSSVAAGRHLEGDWWSPLLGYWFGSLTRKDWFSKNDAVDTDLRERFGGLPDAVQSAQFTADDLTPKMVLAAVLAADQIPRNIYRGTPRAFHYDAEALRLTKVALQRQWEQLLTVDERVFLYLPLEHSEALDDQQLCVDLMGALGDAEYARFAVAHRDIIARFGRFPHRNAILGRMSSPEEEAFLAQPGSSF